MNKTKIESLRSKLEAIDKKREILSRRISVLEARDKLEFLLGYTEVAPGDPVKDAASGAGFVYRKDSAGYPIRSVLELKSKIGVAKRELLDANTALYLLRPSASKLN